VESAPAPNGARSADEAGARLVALNMALEGSPRDATARYLAEQFELADLDALLDDVYASAGK
jgi:beta-phosphoglucomutase-like phosphatase (HAD superfamily)